MDAFFFSDLPALSDWGTAYLQYLMLYVNNSSTKMVLQSQKLWFEGICGGHLAQPLHQNGSSQSHSDLKSVHCKEKWRKFNFPRNRRSLADYISCVILFPSASERTMNFYRKKKKNKISCFGWVYAVSYSLLYDLSILFSTHLHMLFPLKFPAK